VEAMRKTKLRQVRECSIEYFCFTSLPQMVCFSLPYSPCDEFSEKFEVFYNRQPTGDFSCTIPVLRYLLLVNCYSFPLPNAQFLASINSARDAFGGDKCIPAEVNGTRLAEGKTGLIASESRLQQKDDINYRVLCRYADSLIDCDQFSSMKRIKCQLMRHLSCD
jgi:hypothetical protein